MKLNIKNSQYNNQLFKDRNHILNTNMLEKHKNIRESKTNINTNRPAQAISFSGSAVSIVDKFVKSKKLNKVISFVNENEVTYNAIASLVLAGMIKPMIVLNMPGSEDKDKQIVATKNFLQSFVGFFITNTIGGKIVKKAVDTIKNNLKLVKSDGEKVEIVSDALEKAKKIAKKDLIKENTRFTDKFKAGKEALVHASGSLKNKAKAFFNGYKSFKPQISEEAVLNRGKQIVSNLENSHLKIFQKNPKFIQQLIESTKDKRANYTLMNSYETVWKNSSGWITAIMKAKVSSILLPTVMAALFAKKNIEKQQQKSKEVLQNTTTDSTLYTTSTFKKEQENYRAIFNKNNLSKNINFKGKVGNILAEGLAKGVEHISLTTPAEKFTKGLLKLPKVAAKPAARMGDLESGLITTYWVVNTHNSKKIDPDQKLGLNVHTILVTLVSSTVAFIVDTLLDKKMDEAVKTYEETILDTAKQAVKDSNPKEFIKNATENLFNPKEIASSLIDEAGNILKDYELANKALDLSTDYRRKLGKFKSLTVFVMIVRFLIPILMVPISGKMKKKITAWKKEQDAKKTQKA